ncbi:MAG: winged helix-turn-helix domain-containing protein [Nanoarchaeota archaeon]
MERKRSRTDIVADILSTIQDKGGEIKPTHLMYKSNLSHKQMQTYLDDLVQNELVDKVSKKNYQYIIITDKGHRFMAKLKEMKEFEKAFGL